MKTKANNTEIARLDSVKADKEEVEKDLKAL